MTTKHTTTITCDICKAESQSSVGWARIGIDGGWGRATSGVGGIDHSPDKHYDLCPKCWKPIHNMIYESKPIYPKKSAAPIHWHSLDTWELTFVPHDRKPIVGETRYRRERTANPAEPLGPDTHFQKIVWTGKDWVSIPEESDG